MATKRSHIINKPAAEILKCASLREKCPYSDLFWPVFSQIQAEYGEICGNAGKCGKIGTRITVNMDTFHAVLNF